MNMHFGAFRNRVRWRRRLGGTLFARGPLWSSGRGLFAKSASSRRGCRFALPAGSFGARGRLLRRLGPLLWCLWWCWVCTHFVRGRGCCTCVVAAGRVIEGIPQGMCSFPVCQIGHLVLDNGATVTLIVACLVPCPMTYNTQGERFDSSLSRRIAS